MSKTILENINRKIKGELRLNQWINTTSTINWFDGISNKDKCTFVQFDIVDYYPSITKELFHKALDFASTHVDITSEEKDIIYKCRKTVLVKNGEQWIKKDSTDSFDVAMGSLDSAEMSDLVGLFILYKLIETGMFSVRNIGLYRDDGLAVIEDSNGPKVEMTKKFIFRTMKKLGLKVEITAGIKITNFLDITLNLNQGVYKPYMKDNYDPIYVNPKSNHPPSVIKQIPLSIGHRISNNSSNEEIFNNNSSAYNNALSGSGYINKTIEYQDNRNRNNSRTNRKRKIIWYTPPFNQLVKSKIGHMFLKLLNKHFPINNPLHKIFNKNTIKLSYSCTNNLEKIIKGHNRQILKDNANNVSSVQDNKCNCRNKSECPLQEKCLMKNVVYLSTVFPENDPNQKKFYIGGTSTEFKDRYRNHKCSFSNIDTDKSGTSLSRYILSLKRNGIVPVVKWSIIKKAPIPTLNNPTCFLCLNEKLAIVLFPNKNALLNQRDEVGYNCRHFKKFTLDKYCENDVNIT